MNEAPSATSRASRSFLRLAIYCVFRAKFAENRQKHTVSPLLGSILEIVAGGIFNRLSGGDDAAPAIPVLPPPENGGFGRFGTKAVQIVSISEIPLASGAAKC
ncbi:hypothetical protein [Oceaniglobus roseus]|uniref:hypothetical protein n=1 Tax=Oceaniglobus roseus TaxID=1737570 RepID=UPI0012FFD958|nr:hypothetical protein [Kandeliimicrobium roseum]